MARKRKKSRAKKRNRSEATPPTDSVGAVDAVDSVDAADAAGPVDAASPVDAAGPVDRDDAIEDVASGQDRSDLTGEVVELDSGSIDDSLDELLAAASGSDLTTLSDLGSPDAGLELGPDEPQWLDVPDDPLPVVGPELTNLDDPSIDEDVVEISLDDDIAEADPDLLIAEMLAMVDGETAGGETGKEAPASDPSDAQSEDAGEAGSGGEAGRAGSAPDDEDTMLSGEYTLPPTTDTGPPPRITAAALQALRGIQTEGLASLPPEVVLDLGDPDSPADRDRLLQAALAQAEMQDAIYRVPGPERGPRSAKPFIVGAVLAVALLVAVNPPGFLTPPPHPVITVGDRLLGHRVTLLMQAQQVEAFRSTNGRLPTSLAELDQPLPGIQFVKSNNRLYQLVLRTEDRTLIYDSASPDPAFAALSGRWITTRENP